MNLHDEINAFYDSTALCNLRFMNKRFATKMPNFADHRQKLLSVNEEAVRPYRVYCAQEDLASKQISEQFLAEDVEKFCRMLRIFTDINFKDCEWEAIHGE